MSEPQAHAYYVTYRALLEEVEGNESASKPLVDYQVDVRCFALFIGVQLFVQTAKYSSEGARTLLAKDTWGIREPSATPSLSSPRFKATKINYTTSEYSIITHFVKSNLKLFLRLVSSDIHNTEVSLSATEFNTLRILFYIPESMALPLS